MNVITLFLIFTYLLLSRLKSENYFKEDLTRVKTNSEPDIFSRSMRYCKSFDCGQKMKGHWSNFSCMANTIANGKAWHDHVCISDCFNLQKDISISHFKKTFQNDIPKRHFKKTFQKDIPKSHFKMTFQKIP